MREFSRAQKCYTSREHDESTESTRQWWPEWTSPADVLSTPILDVVCGRDDSPGLIRDHNVSSIFFRSFYFLIWNDLRKIGYTYIS